MEHAFLSTCLSLQVMSGNVSNGFEKLVELLNDHRGVITVRSNFLIFAEYFADYIYIPSASFPGQEKKIFIMQ